jgi:hypothetical protein
MSRLPRRKVLKAAAAAGATSILSRSAPCQETAAAPAWKKRVLEYLQRHARDDGGYGWDGQERSHLTPTFAVIGCYKLLGEEPPNKKALAQFVRTHHPRELKNLAQEHRAFDWQQIQALVWLGEDVSDFRPLVRSWKAPYAYPKQYEQHGWPVFQQEVAAILSWKLVGLPMEEIPAVFIEYVNSRRRPNGSFNGTPASDGSQGHVLNTWWGLQALEALSSGQQPVDWMKLQIVPWLQNCQVTDGGFTYQPPPRNANHHFYGGRDDIVYTWAAVRSLRLLGWQPRDRNSCVRAIKALAKFDGGFSDRPGWLANPLATYYALDSLAALGALDSVQFPKRIVNQREYSPHPDLRVFSIQIEAHGQGSPAEAIDLADTLRIHLWGAKNAKPEWLARAQALANREGIPTQFFVANEEYGTWIDVPGMGTYSHMSDIMGPAGTKIPPPLAGKKAVSWTEFLRQRLGWSPQSNIGLAVASLPTKADDATQAKLRMLREFRLASDGEFANQGYRLVWQFGENEPLVRMLLDDSIARGGFAAISTFHFGNPDFTNSQPFLMRYRGQLPFVSLQDAHGPEPWWFADMTEGFRTLFLARKPTWEGWLEALKNNWVVAVRHDAVSGGQTWMHGMPEVIEVVQQQWRSWQWWDNPAIKRPLVSVVAIKPEDEFEVGRPERGVAIRVRCAWQNTTQGLPKKPMTELVKLMVARKQVQPEHVIRRRSNEAMEDDYYIYNWPDAPAGKYTASATVRNIATGEEIWRPIEFVV